MSNPSGSNWTTNVNRSKTKRWVEAKSYSYDGDDWGDLDEYGEYDEPKPTAKPAGLRKATAPASVGGPAQSSIAERERTGSFTQDDERRAFSGPTRTAYAQTQPPGAQPTSTQIQNTSQVSNEIRGTNAPYDGRSTSMTSANNSPAGIGGRRKPSAGQIDQNNSTMAPIATNIEPPPTIGLPEKPSTPTLIRPADIYRRMQEEKEKERLSQESSRPSLSGLARDESPARKSDISGRQTQAAAPIVATPQPINPHNDILRSKGPSYSPQLPEISGLSGFGEDFGGSFLSTSTSQLSKVTSADTVEPAEVVPKSSETDDSTVIQNTKPSDSTLHHQPSLGYKSVVSQAFDQAVPPTPSTTSGSGIDRSNSDSTANISPIISRETSTAAHPDGITNISSIIEEPNESSRPTTAQSKPITRSGIDEPAAFIPGHRRDTSLPSANNSPGRTPTVESSKQLVAPQEAEIAVTTPTSGTLPLHIRDRSSSPTKNRVRDLVDKIDGSGGSGRGAQPFLADAGDTQRPHITAKESFRPNIPGAWTSYTTNPPPLQTPENDTKGLAEPQIKVSNDQPAETKEDQFAKAAAAGSALAGALAAAAGLSTTSDTNSEFQGSEPRKTASTTGTAFHPDARLVLPRQDSDAPSSIVPTPLDMKPGANQQPEYFGTSTSSGQRPVIPSGTSLHVPQTQDGHIPDDLSTHSSPTDFESDKLRKEIVRELSPQRDVPDKQQLEVQDPKNEGGAGYSAIYDSYLEEEDAQNQETRIQGKAFDMQNIMPQPRAYEDSSPPMFASTSGPLEDVPEGPPMSETSHSLKRQFSWETPLENLGTSQTRIDQVEDASLTDRQQDTVLTVPEPASVHVISNDSEAASQTTNLDKPLLATDTSNVDSTIPARSETLSTPQVLTRALNDPVLPPQTQTKVPAFKEIMAIQSTPQRIQVYDQTRETFAKTETGLVQWIQATISSLPEHEELLRNGGSFPPVLRTPMVSGVQGGQGPSNAPRPSFGPTSSKTVKGKDLLHTAGVFGGKANSAAKGLFAKGRSKWGRSSDKASKRLRGRSTNPSNDPPSKSLNQQENTWETDVSAPYFSSQTLSRQGTSQNPVAGLPDPSIVPPNNQSHDLPTIASVPSTSISPPTTAPQDSPTLGRSNTTAGGSAVSPLSGRTSFERKRALLGQKRASMEVPSSAKARGHGHSSSVDSHQYGPNSHHGPAEKPAIPAELQARLTVHQNQMRSFGEEFPADLIIPAEYTIPPDAQKIPPKAKDSSAEKTPTQADFPKEIVGDRTNTTSPLHTEETKKAERKNTSSALWLDTSGTTQDHTFDGPASPDYALRKEEEAVVEENDEKSPSNKRPGTHKHFSSFSFIQFDPMPSADLTLKNPITPRRQSFSRERSDTGTSSQHETQASESSFADYPAAEDFGALPAEPSVSSAADLDHTMSIDSQTMQNDSRPEQITHQLSQGSESTRSRSSMIVLATKRLSKQLGDNALDSPTILKQESYQAQDGVQKDLTNAHKRHSMLSDVRESRELYPDGKDNRKQNRKSLLGLGLSMRPPTSESLPAKAAKGPKFTLIPSIRKRTDTDLSRYEADVSRPALTTDKNPFNVQRSATAVLDGEKQNLNSGAAENLGSSREKAKRRRFSGLSSFINKAKPRLAAVSNATRGRSPTPLGTVVDSKRDITPERLEVDRADTSRNEGLGQASPRLSTSVRSTNEGNDVSSIAGDGASASKDKLIVPKAHIRNASSIPDISSNQEAVVNKITAPPENGPDYKTVYPPEFFGEQPPQGYYSPEETPDVVVKTAPEAKGSTVRAVLPEPFAPEKGLAETGKDQTRLNQARPPPLPLKDTSKHSKAAMKQIAASYAIQGSVKTASDAETPVSQLATDDTRSYGKNRATITDSIISSLDTPFLNSPVMHTATTRTMIRIANEQSISPNSRSENRSSLPTIAPLKIAKKSPTFKDERQDEILDPSSERHSPAVESPQLRSGTPQLTVNTRTGPLKPAPIEQLSSKSATMKDLDRLQTSSPPNRPLPHPFVAKRTASSPAVPTMGSQGLSKNGSNFPFIAQPDTVPNGERSRTMTTLERPSITQNTSTSSAMDGSVVVIRPLTIKKSPEIGTNKSPSLDTMKTLDQPTQSVVESSDKRSSTKSSPLSPTRASLHSPALKDSPTLPRPAPSQATLLDRRSNTPNGVFLESQPIPRSTPMDQATKPKQTTPEKEETPSPTNGTIVHAPDPMTPVEKMKDEPRVKETAKESDESEDEIVMSSTAYPGQEWRPDYGYGGWDGYE